MAGEELWEEVVAAARMLANSTEAEVEVYARNLKTEENFCNRLMTAGRTSLWHTGGGGE